MTGWVGKDGLTNAQEAVLHNVMIAAGLPQVPADLNPELRSVVSDLKAGKKLKPEEIIARVENEVDLNSRLY
jgi:hypothetical protein